MDRIREVLVNLFEIPSTGSTRLIVRLWVGDKPMIDRAARALGMTQARFMRTVLVNAARQVMDDIAAKERQEVAEVLNIRHDLPPGMRR
jgi:uncharacterized protein (DUF1778 family)